MRKRKDQRLDVDLKQYETVRNDHTKLYQRILDRYAVLGLFFGIVCRYCYFIDLFAKPLRLLLFVSGTTGIGTATVFSGSQIFFWFWLIFASGTLPSFTINEVISSKS